MQEALTNALRHSGARRIQVRAVHDIARGQLTLDVEDDGRWLSQKPGQPEPLPAGSGGRGLANMRLRAARLGAQFTLASDERGTRDYNIALGARRANAAKNALAALGIDAARISTVSYGKERPEALGSTEADWARNRRAVTVTVQ